MFASVKRDARNPRNLGQDRGPRRLPGDGAGRRGQRYWRCYRWRKSLNVNATGVLVIPPAVAVICVVPADKPVAKPLPSIVATFGELLAQ